MTEELARTKWCPQVRLGLGPQDPSWQGAMYSNRVNCTDVSCCCIASNCMMWREVKDYTRNSPNDSLGGCEVVGGYCGLAGKL